MLLNVDLSLSLPQGVNKQPQILAEPLWSHEETEGSPISASGSGMGISFPLKSWATGIDFCVRHKGEKRIGFSACVSYSVEK